MGVVNPQEPGEKLVHGTYVQCVKGEGNLHEAIQLCEGEWRVGEWEVRVVWARTYERPAGKLW